MPFLTEHIKKDWIEAFPGDEVTIIADHGNVQIVDKDGIKFPVKTECLSDVPVNNIKIKLADKISEETKPKQRWKKSQPAITQSLF